MAGKRREWFHREKNFLQRNRNVIVYGVMILALLGTLAGWRLLPGQVNIWAPSAQVEAVLRPKNTTLLLHFGMVSLFAALFWKWPRELAYLLGLGLSLMLMYTLLINNLGVG